jgi:toxin HigB-1
MFPFDRFRNAEQNGRMIRSFACAETEALFNSQVVPRFRNMEQVARRRLLQLQAATELASLRVPPGNQLEALKGDRKGQHSIRINDPWRLCFQWRDDGAHQVEIVDYH